MKKTCILLLSLLLGMATLPAQSWKEKLEAMEQRVQKKLDHQKSKVELQFANQMRRVWKEAQLFGGLEPPPVPKPITPQIFDPAITPKGRSTEIILAPQPDPRPTPAPPRKAEPKEVINIPAPAPDPAPRAEAQPDRSTSSLMENRIAALNMNMETRFYGAPVAVRYDRSMQFEPLVYLNEDQIADAWLQLDASRHELLLYQLQRYAERYRLNDWGYMQLVNQTAHELFPRDPNSRTVFNWFCLSKSGYMGTVCYTSNRLYLMLPSEHTLYGRTFLKAGKDLKYYVFDLDGKKPELSKVRVFNHEYPEASRKLNFEVNEAPKFAQLSTYRRLNFNYKGKSFEVPVKLNENLQDFYENYPFMDLEIYMRTPLSPEVRASMVPSLERAIEGMSEQDATHFLLHFVQKAFQYKTDQEQFGKERYLFAEETLYFPYSDCEDRSTLFAYLTRELLGLEVVGLVFPGHAATAVRFNESVGGDYVTYNGEKYIICDPTYINADLGMVLPQYKNKEVRIVKI
jgi:hypothetical protein